MRTREGKVKTLCFLGWVCPKMGTRVWGSCPRDSCPFPFLSSNILYFQGTMNQQDCNGYIDTAKQQHVQLHTHRHTHMWMPIIWNCMCATQPTHTIAFEIHARGAIKELLQCWVVSQKCQKLIIKWEKTCNYQCLRI